MPGKTSQAAGKKGHDASRDRLTSSINNESGSKRIRIWPEWNDADLAQEKWDIAGGATGGKGQKKSIHPAIVYDDPDGVILPHSLADPSKVVWKRLNDETFTEKIVPVIVSNPECTLLDLYTSNKHLLHSQLICWIIGQLNILWHMRHSLSVETGGGGVVEGEKDGSLAWRPWEHIQPQPKGSAAPVVNLGGKYCVRLYWMGCWRKVTIDDKLPFLEKIIPCATPIPPPSIDRGPSGTGKEKEKKGGGKDGGKEVGKEAGGETDIVESTPLYIRTAVVTELWPALLMKAILKVVALDYTEGSPENEFGDSCVIHMLTGWTPYSIPLQPYPSDPSHLWDSLSQLLPLWKRPEVDITQEEQERGKGGEGERDGEGEDMMEKRCSLILEKMESREVILPRSNYIVMGSFTSCCPGASSSLNYNPTSPEDISDTEDLLKKFEIIPPDYSLSTLPSFPTLLTQVRNELLIPPPKEPPLPKLQAPYYLGLKHRQLPPGVPTPPPTPPPVEPWFIELIPALCSYKEVTAQVATSTSEQEGSLKSAKSSTHAIDDSESKLKIVDKPSKLTNESASRTHLTVGARKSSEKSPQIKRKGLAAADSTNSAVNITEPKLKVNLKWMNYLEFLAAFQTIHVFKNPSKFEHRDIYCDLSKTVTTLTNVARSTTATSSKRGISNIHLNSSSKASSMSKDHNYLFVDSVSPVELLFVFSSLSNWREGGKDTHRIQLNAPVAKRPMRGFSPSPAYRPAIAVSAMSDHTRCSTPDAFSTIAEHTEETTSTVEGDGRPCSPSLKRTGGGGLGKILSGSLVMETYSWRTAQFGSPVLQVSTTGVKGAIFTLPPGRHVFKLHVNVPIGHHLEIFSQSSFSLTSEDGIFLFLSQDCSRFVKCSSSIVDNFLSCSEELDVPEALEKCVEDLARLLTACGMTARHSKLLLSSALYSFSVHAKSIELSGKMQSAWKAFLYGLFNRLEEHLPKDDSDHPVQYDITALRNQLKSKCRAKVEERPVPEMWVDRVATTAEEQASKVISTHLSAYAGARLQQRMTPGTEANRETTENLKLSKPLLVSHQELLGTTMLYALLKLDPSLVEKFPFAEDLKSQAYSTVYSGAFPHIESNSWTIVLRRTFHVSEPQLLAFHFHCPLPTHILRIINNDTMQEIPRVFESTIPQTYHPNEKGFTLQAEAWVLGVGEVHEDSQGEDKKWRLRIASSSRDAPPKLEGIESEEDRVGIHDAFHKHEAMNYCLPDREEILFRQMLITSKDCATSLQVTTSKQDAFIKFEILDHEKSLVSVEGHGVCTVPLLFLECSGVPTDATSTTDTTATKSLDQETALHKYIAQARILRKSWPLADTAWPHISTLHQPEDTPAGSGHKPSSGSKKSKGAKERRKTAASVQPAIAAPVTQPASGQIDTTKPHWLLRVVTKGQEECIELRKDTERADMLKSMVQAWETEQPGRCKQAQESRQKFLDARMIRDEKTDADDIVSTSTLEGSGVTPSYPQPNMGPVKIWQMDLTPFIIKESETPILLDDKEKARRLEERQKLFKEYRSSRQVVLDLRNEDRQRRNEAKAKQIELAEQWQADLDRVRKELNHVRESIREKRLAKERAEAEKLKALEETQPAPAGGRDSKTKGKKKKK